MNAEPTMPPGRGNAAQTLFEVLRHRAAADPERDAVVAESGSLSYRALAEAAWAAAAALVADGVIPGDRVALLASNRTEWLATAFGAAAVGATLCPFNTWVKTWDLDYLLTHSRPRVLVTLARYGKQDFLTYLRDLVPELWAAEPGSWRSERYPDLRSVVVLGEEVPRGAVAWWDWTDRPVPSPSPALAHPGDVAMVLYTSGSTARPKGVALRHGDLLANGFAIGERQGLTASDRIYLASPLCWAFGGANALMACLTHGATLVLQEQFQASRALTILREQGCTAMYTLPVMTRALLAEPGFDAGQLPLLRRGLTLGPPVEIRLAAQALGIDQICNIYGSTETYGNCCVTPHDAPLEQRAISQGPPLDGMDVRIVDPASGVALAPGEIGEVWVRGRISPGYVDESGHLTGIVDADGFLHTGDLGWLDDKGWLEFSGRDSEMIKTAGINVSPLEVEEFLLSHPDVDEAAVAGGKDSVRGEQVVAFVRFMPGATTSVEELREWCRAGIASYKVPVKIIVVDDFPATPTGKLARRALSDRASEAVTEGGKGAQGG